MFVYGKKNIGILACFNVDVLACQHVGIPTANMLAGHGAVTLSFCGWQTYSECDTSEGRVELLGKAIALREG
jgi:hypothetical protein